MFFDNILEIMSDKEYDPGVDSNFSFHVGADIFYVLFLYDFFIFFHV